MSYGGTIDNVKQSISSLDRKYEHITLVVGGNDCDVKPAVPPKSVVDSFTDLIDSAKDKANHVNVSSICPRLNCEIAQDTIESANAGLQVACTEKADVSYMDNTPSFKLADGSLNDGYYLADGIHITRAATNKLARNLKLRIKDNVEGACRNANLAAKHIARQQQYPSGERATNHSSDVPWSKNIIAQMMTGQPYVTNVVPITTAVIIRTTRGRVCRDVSSAQKRVMTRLRVDMENISSAIHVMSMAINPNIVICIKNRDSARKNHLLL